MSVQTRARAIWIMAFSASLMACSPDSPNIVFISLDTVRADHVSAYGYSHNTTHSLDRFAARAAVFDHAYA